jgi:hypothetical protein
MMVRVVLKERVTQISYINAQHLMSPLNQKGTVVIVQKEEKWELIIAQ